MSAALDLPRPVVATSPPVALPPTRQAEGSTPDPFLLVAEQALSDEIGIIDVLARAAGVHPLAKARRIRAIADELQAEADVLRALSDRIIQELS
jgi:hypothetical protein